MPTDIFENMSGFDFSVNTIIEKSDSTILDSVISHLEDILDSTDSSLRDIHSSIIKILSSANSSLEDYSDVDSLVYNINDAIPDSSQIDVSDSLKYLSPFNDDSLAIDTSAFSMMSTDEFSASNSFHSTIAKLLGDSDELPSDYTDGVTWTGVKQLYDDFGGIYGPLSTIQFTSIDGDQLAYPARHFLDSSISSTSLHSRCHYNPLTSNAFLNSITLGMSRGIVLLIDLSLDSSTAAFLKSPFGAYFLTTMASECITFINTLSSTDYIAVLSTDDSWDGQLFYSGSDMEDECTSSSTTEDSVGGLSAATDAVKALLNEEIIEYFHTLDISSLIDTQIVSDSSSYQHAHESHPLFQTTQSAFTMLRAGIDPTISLSEIIDERLSSVLGYSSTEQNLKSGRPLPKDSPLMIYSVSFGATIHPSYSSYIHILERELPDAPVKLVFTRLAIWDALVNSVACDVVRNLVDGENYSSVSYSSSSLSSSSISLEASNFSTDEATINKICDCANSDKQSIYSSSHSDIFLSNSADPALSTLNKLKCQGFLVTRTVDMMRIVRWAGLQLKRWASGTDIYEAKTSIDDISSTSSDTKTLFVLTDIDIFSTLVYEKAHDSIGELVSFLSEIFVPLYMHKLSNIGFYNGDYSKVPVSFSLSRSEVLLNNQWTFSLPILSPNNTEFLGIVTFSLNSRVLDNAIYSTSPHYALGADFTYSLSQMSYFMVFSQSSQLLSHPALNDTGTKVSQDALTFIEVFSKRSDSSFVDDVYNDIFERKVTNGVTEAVSYRLIDESFDFLSEIPVIFRWKRSKVSGFTVVISLVDRDMRERDTSSQVPPGVCDASYPDQYISSYELTNNPFETGVPCMEMSWYGGFSHLTDEEQEELGVELVAGDLLTQYPSMRGLDVFNDVMLYVAPYVLEAQGITSEEQITIDVVREISRFFAGEDVGFEYATEELQELGQIVNTFSPYLNYVTRRLKAFKYFVFESGFQFPEGLATYYPIAGALPWDLDLTSRGWFLDPLYSGLTLFREPFVSAPSSTLVIPVSTTVQVDDFVLGIGYISMLTDALEPWFDDSFCGSEEGVYCVLISNRGTLVYSSKSSHTSIVNNLIARDEAPFIGEIDPMTFYFLVENDIFIEELGIFESEFKPFYAFNPLAFTSETSVSISGSSQTVQFYSDSASVSCVDQTSTDSNILCTFSEELNLILCVIEIDDDASILCDEVSIHESIQVEEVDCDLSYTHSSISHLWTFSNYDDLEVFCEAMKDEEACGYQSVFAHDDRKLSSFILIGFAILSLLCILDFLVF
ncbi:hypothetical protein ADUPG1_014859 [Aduncisulcus paluster]|uniref:Uncharacterized protein n=1 Tax=Aduncisulcus paluster TaxID=2918883 RepID=A0ABQ5KBP9_9EUKA|nr:hypothetical protein ADUPG1_014859 [Aduncisulcus paluster]